MPQWVSLTCLAEVRLRVSFIPTLACLICWIGRISLKGKQACLSSYPRLLLAEPRRRRRRNATALFQSTASNLPFPNIVSWDRESIVWKESKAGGESLQRSPSSNPIIMCLRYVEAVEVTQHYSIALVTAHASFWSTAGATGRRQLVA
jgi:hypothetical protein